MSTIHPTIAQAIAPWVPAPSRVVPFTVPVPAWARTPTTHHCPPATAVRPTPIYTAFGDTLRCAIAQVVSIRANVANRTPGTWRKQDTIAWCKYRGILAGLRKCGFTPAAIQHEIRNQNVPF